MVGTRSGFLLDANVISELFKPRPNQRVAGWLDATAEDLLFLSVLAIGEVRKGVDLLEEGDPKRGALQGWLDFDLRVRFSGRFLPFDEGVAERWGQLEAVAKRQRLVLPTVDVQLAATALHHGLTLATRNTQHLRPTGVPLFNPWSDTSSR